MKIMVFGHGENLAKMENRFLTNSAKIRQITFLPSFGFDKSPYCALYKIISAYPLKIRYYKFLLLIP